MCTADLDFFDGAIRSSGEAEEGAVDSKFRGWNADLRIREASESGLGHSGPVRASGWIDRSGFIGPRGAGLPLRSTRPYNLVRLSRF